MNADIALQHIKYQIHAVGKKKLAMLDGGVHVKL